MELRRDVASDRERGACGVRKWRESDATVMRCSNKLAPTERRDDA